MPVYSKLLEVLCCPKTRAPLTILSPDKLINVNESILQEKLRYSDNTIVEKPLEEALITEDGKTIYRIDNGIPIMMPDKGIPFTQSS